MTQPSRKLPERPNLRRLKDEAKARIRSGEFAKLSDAQLAIARELGFASWPKLCAHVENASRTSGPPSDADPRDAYFAAVRDNDRAAVKAMLARHPEFLKATIAGSPWTLDGTVWAPGQRRRLAPDDPKQTTALHFAAVHGHVALAEVLLDAGHDVDALSYGDDMEVCPPLQLAAWEGGPAMTRLLLEHGADPNLSRSERHNCALFTAAEHYAWETCDLLLKHGAKPDLHSAIMIGLKGAMISWLDAHPELLETEDEWRHKTPLATAVAFNRVELARLLIDRGAKITLTQACGLGDLNLVRQLLARDASALNGSLEDENQETPLMAAAQAGHRVVVRYLLEHGTDPNGGTGEGHRLRQPIHVAAANCIDELVAAGADVNRPYRGFTALQRAIKDHPDRAQAFARHGGTRNFHLVGHLTQLKEHLPELLRLGANINEPDADGRTALDNAMDVAERLAASEPAQSRLYADLVQRLRELGGRRGAEL